jgi:hypothetical protein
VVAALVVHLMSPGAAAKQPGWDAPDGSMHHEFVSWREIPPTVSTADLVVAHGLAALVVSQTMTNIGPGLVYRPTGTARSRRRPWSRRLRASWVVAPESRVGMAAAAALGLDRERVAVVADDDHDAWNRLAWSLVRFEQIDRDLLPGRPARVGPLSALRRAFGRSALAPPEVQVAEVDAPVVVEPIVVEPVVADPPAVVPPVAEPAPELPVPPAPDAEPTAPRRVARRSALRRAFVWRDASRRWARHEPSEADARVDLPAPDATVGDPPIEEPVLEPGLDAPVVEEPVVEEPVVAEPVADLPSVAVEVPAPSQPVELPFEETPVAPAAVETEPVVEPEAAPPPLDPRPAIAARADLARISSAAPRGSPPIVAMESVDPTSPGHPWWKYRRPDVVPRTLGGRPRGSTPLPDSIGAAASGAGGNGAVGDGGGRAAGPPPGEPPAPGAPVAGPQPEPPAESRSAVEIVQTAVRSGVGLFIIGVALLAAVAVAAQLGTIGEGPFVIPLAGLFLVLAAGRRIVRNHPAEAWVANWLLLGFFVKLGAAYARYFTTTVTYGGGDVTGYDQFGREFAQHWLKGTAAPKLTNLKQTNFIRWFTGVVYYVFGQKLVTASFVFALFALIGSYFWYRATVEAVPMVDKRLYLGFVLFAPSIAFWPAEVGKEALMQLGLGTLALGISLLLRQRLLAGLLVLAPGGWLVWVVRPHLLAMVAIGGGAAYLAGRVRARDGKKAGLFSRPLGIVIVAFLVAFTVGQGAKFLGLSSFSFSSIQGELNATTTSTGQGGSSFNNGGHTLNPIHYPQDVLTVLVRPFPWEVHGGLQLFASAEGMALVAFAVARRESLRIAFRRSRENPFLMFCWVLTALYCIAFASFANFGLLVRERSLVLGAVLVLISVDPTFEHRRRREEEQAEVWSAASLASHGADA